MTPQRGPKTGEVVGRGLRVLWPLLSAAPEEGLWDSSPDLHGSRVAQEGGKL